jgi:hypothetical protein
VLCHGPKTAPNFGLTIESVSMPEFTGLLDVTSNRYTSPRNPTVVRTTRLHSISLCPNSANDVWSSESSRTVA